VGVRLGKRGSNTDLIIRVCLSLTNALLPKKNPLTNAFVPYKPEIPTTGALTATIWEQTSAIQ
jgi:hypothetical protein